MPTRREFAKSLIDCALRQTLTATDRKTGGAFLALVATVQARSELLRPARAVGRIASDRVAPVVSGLLALVENRRDWLRPAEEWEPMGAGPHAQFSSLAHHLFANYPVPPVLLSAWFTGRDWPARRRQGWFRQAGQGKSLRQIGLPLPMTRRMAHEFAHAPAAFPIEFAVRWAQVMGLGGSDELARAVASTRLGRWFVYPEFWTSLIHLFLNTPRLDPAHVEPIVDYLHDQKFDDQQVIIGDDTEVYLDPPQPDLELKGRTVASLLRQVAEWKVRHQPSEPERRLFRWQRSGIAPYRRAIDEVAVWTLRELLDSNDLAAEGKAMRHCVATYTSHCTKGISAIWSLGIDTPEGRERVLTVEVNPESREIVQARARDNDDPDEAAHAVLVDWASRAGLTLNL